MENILDIINAWIEKYQISEEDVIMLQTALEEFENGSDFNYEEESVEEVPVEE